MKKQFFILVFVYIFVSCNKKESVQKQEVWIFEAINIDINGNKRTLKVDNLTELQLLSNYTYSINNTEISNVNDNSINLIFTLKNSNYKIWDYQELVTQFNNNNHDLAYSLKTSTLPQKGYKTLIIFDDLYMKIQDKLSNSYKSNYDIFTYNPFFIKNENNKISLIPVVQDWGPSIEIVLKIK
jgi:hypothetical protein